MSKKPSIKIAKNISPGARSALKELKQLLGVSSSSEAISMALKLAENKRSVRIQ